MAFPEPAADEKTVVEQVLEKQGRSIRWLAQTIEVEPSYAHRMIHGERPLTPEFKRDAARILGVPEDILFPTTSGVSA